MFTNTLLHIRARWILLVIISYGIPSYITLAQSATGCIEFNGSNSYVDLGSNVLDNARTIEFWFQPSKTITPSLSEPQTLIARNSDNCGECEEVGIIFNHSGWPNPGTIRFKWNSAPNVVHNVYTNQSIWNANQWYHLAAVQHPAKGMLLFIDGILQNSTIPTQTSSLPVSSYLVTLGKWGDLNYRYFNGLMEDVRISGSALYDSNFTPPCPDIPLDPSTKALFHFNNSSGNIAVDSSPSAENATLHNIVRTSSFICTNPDTTTIPNDTTSSVPNDTSSTVSTDSVNNTIPTVFNCQIVKSTLTVPNIITPNDDLLNDQFLILSDSVVAFESIEIYNRWGNMIYESNSPFNTNEPIELPNQLSIGWYYYRVYISEDCALKGYFYLSR